MSMKNPKSIQHLWLPFYSKNPGFVVFTVDLLLSGGLTKCFNYRYYDGLNSNKIARSDFILIKDIFGTLVLFTFCFDIFGS